MNKYQKRVVAVVLNIIGLIGFIVLMFASIGYNWWLGQAIVIAVLAGFMGFAVVLLVMEAVMRWRLRGACQCDADLDVLFWFRATIQENRFDETIERLENEQVSSLSALGKQGTIDALRRFQQVKRPKFLWWEY